MTTTTKEELRAVWMAARSEANDAREHSLAVYAKSRGPKDPAAIAAKEASDRANAKRDAAKAAYDAA